MGEWIPIGDRKPKEGIDVLAYIRYPQNPSGAMIVLKYVANEKYESWNDGEYEYGKDVTHWMPLPEPPKVDSSSRADAGT